jgi:hypothetical protein
MVFGLLQAGVCRYFMTRKLPWMVREGTVLVFIYSIARDGVEMSLPKMVGAIMMFFHVYTLLVRFGYPRALGWLDRTRAASGKADARART